jgi:hypothetical protein
MPAASPSPGPPIRAQQEEEEEEARAEHHPPADAAAVWAAVALPDQGLPGNQGGPPYQLPALSPPPAAAVPGPHVHHLPGVLSLPASLTPTTAPIAIPGRSRTQGQHASGSSWGDQGEQQEEVHGDDIDVTGAGAAHQLASLPPLAHHSSWQVGGRTAHDMRHTPQQQHPWGSQPTAARRTTIPGALTEAHVWHHHAGSDAAPVAPIAREQQQQGQPWFRFLVGGPAELHTGRDDQAASAQVVNVSMPAQPTVHPDKATPIVEAAAPPAPAAATEETGNQQAPDGGMGPSAVATSSMARAEGSCQNQRDDAQQAHVGRSSWQPPTIEVPHVLPHRAAAASAPGTPLTLAPPVHLPEAGLSARTSMAAHRSSGGGGPGGGSQRGAPSQATRPVGAAVSALTQALGPGPEPGRALSRRHTMEESHMASLGQGDVEILPHTVSGTHTPGGTPPDAVSLHPSLGRGGEMFSRYSGETGAVMGVPAGSAPMPVMQAILGTRHLGLQQPLAHEREQQQQHGGEAPACGPPLTFTHVMSQRPPATPRRAGVTPTIGFRSPGWGDGMVRPDDDQEAALHSARSGGDDSIGDTLLASAMDGRSLGDGGGMLAEGMGSSLQSSRAGVHRQLPAGPPLILVPPGPEASAPSFADALPAAAARARNRRGLLYFQQEPQDCQSTLHSTLDVMQENQGSPSS